MKKDNQEFINYTKQVWQPYYRKELSESDAVEIIDNMTAFIKLLIEWDKKQAEKESGQILNIEKKNNRSKKNE